MYNPYKHSRHIYKLSGGRFTVTSATNFSESNSVSVRIKKRGVVMLNAVFEWLRCVVLMTGYVSGGASFPTPLAPDEEAECLRRLGEGSEDAKNTLIERNLRLVAHITKKYCDETNAEDLISIGTIGLIKGINTFRPDKNKKLSSYIARCIENEVLMHLRSQRRHKNDVYIDDGIGMDSDGNSLTLADILPSGDADVADTVSDSIETRKLYKCMKTVLTPAEYGIVKDRYGLGGTPRLTQRQIAEKLGISRSYVSRIEKRCLEKLAQVLER